MVGIFVFPGQANLRSEYPPRTPPKGETSAANTDKNAPGNTPPAATCGGSLAQLMALPLQGVIGRVVQIRAETQTGKVYNERTNLCRHN
jgi:hypothetical protein